MPIKRTQNKVAESRFTLPVTAALALLAVLSNGSFGWNTLLSIVVIAVSTLLMVELNNSNALIRIYSRMVSCSFLVLTITLPACETPVTGNVVQFCFIAAYLLLFRTYQDNTSSGYTFYAFLFLGIASTLFIQALFYVPLMWILMLTNTLSLSWKTFRASLLGLLFPYWIVAGLSVYTNDLNAIPDHFSQLAAFANPLSSGFSDVHKIVTLAYIAALGAVGATHFLRHSYLDKIRTRMLYELFIAVSAFSLVFTLLQPQHYDYLVRIMIVNVAPLIGHFLALTRTRFTNISFFAISLSALLLIAFNLWIPSFRF